MGWEQRGNNSYFYRKEWQGGRCVSTYLGSSEIAVLIGECERYRQAEEALEREQQRRRRAESEAGSKVVGDVGKCLRELTYAVLSANGFHQHKGQWRKRMDKQTDQSTSTAMQTPGNESGIKAGIDALRKAMSITPTPTGKKGKITPQDEAQAEIEKRAAVRRVLRDYPCIWPTLRGSLTGAQDQLIKYAGSAPDSATGQIFGKTLESMRTDLGYADSPMLERLLIEHIALAWLDLDTVYRLYGLNMRENHTLKLGTYWDKRLNSAQQRYLRAVETLARVRRLSRATPLQVNIGGQQINVAGGGTV